MTKYYQKEIPESPVYVQGTPLKFDILETADPVLIEELDKCVLKGRGGVFSITAEVYAEELKKKASGSSLPFGSTQKHSRQELSALLLNPRNVADGASGLDFSGSVFANRQDVGRDHTPHNRFGLPGGVPGPSGMGANGMPDPIEVPTPADLKPSKPPTAKLSEVVAPA